MPKLSSMEKLKIVNSIFDSPPVKISYLTANVLEAAASGEDGKLVRGYLGEYTLSYLRTAAVSGIVLYENSALRGRDFSPDEEEVARHAFVIMAHMHQAFELPIGGTFSRRGLLRAPGSYEEYTQRIRAMDLHIRAVIAVGFNKSRWSKLEADEFRTGAFFKTAKVLSLELPPTERDTAEGERYKLEKLLEGIDLNF